VPTLPVGFTLETSPSKTLSIPILTLQNLDQGRVLPDPAARSPLTIVAKNPKVALKALAA
jgi:DNA-binding transcriptional regulator YiaG